MKARNKDTSLIAEEILGLRKNKDLRLTVYGAITLSPFSRNVILRARGKLRKSRGKYMNIDKPFNYFLALCHDATRELNEVPLWSKGVELCKHYGVEGAIRVTEDDEFLMDSPLSIRKAVESPSNLIRDPKRERAKMRQFKNSPQFDGMTYMYRGKKYLKPKEGKEYFNSEVESRLDKPREYWDNEKRKFIETAKHGKVSLEGIKFLVAAGLLVKDDLADIVTDSNWPTYELGDIIEQCSQREEELNEISKRTDMGVHLPNHGGAGSLSESGRGLRASPVERIQAL